MQHRNELINVALPLPIHREFTYRLSVGLDSQAQAGMRVLVPFGKKYMTGFIVDFPEATSLKRVKSVIDIIDEEPMISSEQLRLARWMATYYICPLGEVLRAMVPGGLQIASHILLHPTEKLKQVAHQIPKMATSWQREILAFVMTDKSPTIRRLIKQIQLKHPYARINQLEKDGWITRTVEFNRARVQPKKELWVRLSETYMNMDEYELTELKTRKPARARCIKALRKRSSLPRHELVRVANVSASVVRAMIEQHELETYEKEIMRDYRMDYNVTQRTDIVLNDEQQQAVDAINKSLHRSFFDVFLLYGVTGSGKTQVYIDVLKQVIRAGKTAIILVPEISLTPQTVSRFTANFPEQVAVLHSRMSAGERFDSWRRIRQGEFKIVIGPRSAVFAPLDNLGLIVVDEEHEASYKQYEPVPLYHARDVAIIRCKLNEAIALLGSATPSIESFHNARMGKYKLLTLSKRIDDIPLPTVKVYDMRELPKNTIKGELRIFSPAIEKQIRQKLDVKEQIILLQNRRGYSPFIMCKDCGFIERCPNCDVTLTFHVSVHRLRCHYCNYIKKAFDVCGNCGSYNILYQGIGTQRVEEELHKKFPSARILRMDLDTTAQKQSHERMLQDFANHKYDILLGTQMVAKGLDFERVTLVGVVSADTAMFLPDFRASERTFQLLTQVAGRAGRKNNQGQVIIQTHTPENWGLICARTHDFLKFYAAEIQNRRELDYPPFSRLIQILIKGTEEQDVIQSSQAIQHHLASEEYPWQLLGPVPAPIARVQQYHRWHLILKVDKKRDPAGKMTSRVLAEMIDKVPARKNSTRVTINVDPMTMI